MICKGLSDFSEEPVLSGADWSIDESIVLEEGLLVVPTRIFLHDGELTCTSDFEFLEPNPHWHPTCISVVEPNDFYISDEDDQSITFESIKWMHTMIFFDKSENAYYVLNTVSEIESRFETLEDIQDACSDGILVFR